MKAERHRVTSKLTALTFLKKTPELYHKDAPMFSVANPEAEC
jgi:hypothetical protein